MWCTLSHLSLEFPKTRISSLQHSRNLCTNHNIKTAVGLGRRQGPSCTNSLKNPRGARGAYTGLTQVESASQAPASFAAANAGRITSLKFPLMRSCDAFPVAQASFEGAVLLPFHALFQAEGLLTPRSGTSSCRKQACNPKSSPAAFQP